MIATRAVRASIVSPGGWDMLALMVVAAAVAADTGVSSMINEESPDVFLAKATLQQYLSRVVRKDWDGARRLTHPKALGVIENLRKRTGSEQHNLAPWANREAQLKTFRFNGAREAGPGVVLVQVGEDSYRTEEQGMSVDDPAVYMLFKSRGGYLVGDKKAGASLDEVSDESVRIGYPGYVDEQVKAQARRQAHAGGPHR
jgi:hypothetical protein